MGDHRTVQIIVYTVFFLSIFMIMIGLIWWVRGNCNEKILQRDLNRPRNLTLSQQMSQAIRHWDVFIPTCLIINGFILAIIAILLHLFG
ncbi:MAG: hypothetical protein AB7S78_06740 [Candidatus Omnitrophota bacterium]